MQAITVVVAAPANPDAGIAAGSAVLLNRCKQIQVQIKAQTAPVAVRPYYWGAGGQWVPLGADASAPLQAVSGDPAKYGGFADGRYDAPPGGTYWCLVIDTTGAPADIASAYIGEVPDTNY